MTLHLPDLPPFVVGLRNQEAEEVSKFMDGKWASPSNCWVCGNTTTFRWYVYESEEWRKKKTAELKKVEEYSCPCVDQWVLSRYLQARGIRADCQTSSILDVIDPQTQKIAVDYIYYLDKKLKYGEGMMLQGPPGTGKSLIAGLIAKAVASKNRSCYLATFSDVVSNFITSKFSAEQRDILASKLKGVDLLVLDQVGAEYKGYQGNVTNEAQGLMSDVLRDRHSRSLATIVTTNLYTDNIKAAYGASVVSLLGELTTHRLDGMDMRDAKGARRKMEVDNGLVRPVTFGVCL